MAMNSIYLLTQADDLGGSRSANRAVLDACQGGLLRNASFMAIAGEVSAEAARMVAAIPNLCVGLHCTLHSEWDRIRWKPLLPAKQVPSLIREDGTFRSSPLEMKEAGFDMKELFAELDAQLGHTRKLGIQPVYADTHMRFDWIDDTLPALFDAWCESEGLLSFRQLCRQLPEPSAPSEDAVETLIDRLSLAEPGLYGYVTHPTFDDEEIRAFGNADILGEEIARERDGDRRLWRDQRVADAFRNYHVIPVRYDEAANLAELEDLREGRGLR